MDKLDRVHVHILLAIIQHILIIIFMSKMRKSESITYGWHRMYSNCNPNAQKTVSLCKLQASRLTVAN